MDPEGRSRDGDVEYFKTVDLEILQNYRRQGHFGVYNVDHATCLHIAASDGQLACCKVIYERCPELFFIEDSDGNTIFHLASTNAVLQFFLEIAGSLIEEDGDMEKKTRYKNVLKKQNNDKIAAFFVTIITHRYRAAMFGTGTMKQLDGAKLWLKANRDNNLDLLNSLYKGKESLIELAVSEADLDLVKLLIDEEPDYVSSPNSDGAIPLWRAMAYSFEGESTRVQIRKLLLEYQPNQAMVLTEKEKYSALHIAAAYGNVETVSDIIELVPKCMELVDIKGQNFLHTAIEVDQQVGVVIHVLDRDDVPDSVLNQVDNNGNTPLHLAARTGVKNLVLALLYDSRVDKTIRNAQGKMATDFITFEFDENRAGVKDPFAFSTLICNILNICSKRP